ncbi:MAG TPA: MgtC/SapB family protein [Longimicrobiales bacterium]|nr:MgtC/SapB family protein [Longimicrobiales bacterium]
MIDWTSVPWEAIGRLGLAILLGGLIGAERELHDRAAGLRTIMLVSGGAALFTIYSPVLGGADDPVRIMAGVVSGVGFLGAGVILREGGRVSGITTAATIWIAAAVGMGAGAGFYVLAPVAALMVLVVLSAFYLVENRIDTAREVRTYDLTLPLRYDKVAELETAFRESSLHVTSHRLHKHPDRILLRWRATGRPAAHDDIVRLLFSDEEVSEVRY